MPEITHETTPEIHIVASFYPVYVATLNVIGSAPGISLTTLAGPGSGCLHNYILTPGDLKTLNQSQALIINGSGMEEYLGKLISQLPKTPIIDASRHLEHPDHGERLNPHTWLSVANAIGQVRAIREGLSRIDPARAAIYGQNAAAYIQRLEALKDEFHTALQGAESRRIAVFDDSFDHLARELDLEIVATVQDDPAAALSARALAATIRAIQAANPPALFTDAQYPCRAAEVISREIGIPLHELDPAVSGPMNDPGAYLTIMRKNLRTLERALIPRGE